MTDHLPDERPPQPEQPASEPDPGQIALMAAVTYATRIGGVFAMRSSG